MESRQPILHIQNLTVDFRSGQSLTRAVDGLTLQVRRGETLAIVGESGSGKSVTSLSILGLVPSPPAIYSSGQILFEDQGKTIDLLRLTPEELQAIRGQRIGMIFQEPMTSLNPVIRCGEQVMEALRLHRKLSYAAARQETLALFEKVKLPSPSDMLRRYPHQLSGGQKQRVMIAMAICCKPSLLICDEPTTALDVTVQQTILNLIRELKAAENMAVIFITHDLGVVSEIADRAAVMYKGKLVEEARINELFHHPVNPYTRALLQCRPILHRSGERLPTVSDFMNPGSSNNPVAPVILKKSPPPAKPLLQVNNLSVWFPLAKNILGKPRTHLRAVDNVSFEVFPGETLGLVGESGCGKTTLGRALLRLAGIHSGEILFQGKDLAKIKPAPLKDLRQDLQIVFQDPYSSLNPRLQIGPAIEEPLRVHRPELTRLHRRELVGELLEKVNLPADHARRYPHEFSGGQRQRIVIARALSLNPSFIVFDESVSALDVSVQAQVLNLINDLKAEYGFTAIFISHDLSVIRYISDRIMVMNKGKIEEIGPAESVYHHPQSEYTRSLIRAIPKGR